MQTRAMLSGKHEPSRLNNAATRKMLQLFTRKIYMRIARAGLALCMVLVSAVAAPARTLTIQSFKAEVTISPDGAIDVVETIQAHFAGSFNGLYRTVPVDYKT